MKFAFLAGGIDYRRLVRLLMTPPESRDLSDIPEALRPLAADARQTTQTPDAMMAGLHQLQDILQRPLILVATLNVNGSDGRPFPERAQINDELRRFCEEAGETFFDPLPIAHDYGITEALADNSHYAKPFLLVLKDRLAGGMAEGVARGRSQRVVGLGV